MAVSTTTKTQDQKEIQEEMAAKLHEGVTNVMESKQFKAWLQTSGKLAINNYSFRNSMLVFASNPDATHTMGYEQWKDVGRQVRKGAQGIRIWKPVMAKESSKGGLFAMLKKNLSEQLQKDPSMALASFQLGQSVMEITMQKNGIMGLKMAGKERAIFKSDEECKRFLDKQVLGKLPLYFTHVSVFDKSDVYIPEYLWVKKGYSQAELALDGNGQEQRNGRGEVKIVNTPERQAKFVERLDMQTVMADPVKMEKLFQGLQAVSAAKGIPMELIAAKDDEILASGAAGYYHRPDENGGNEYIRIDSSLNPTERVTVAFHEMAHSDMHKDLDKLSEQMQDTVDRKLLEVQAEAVAYMTASTFGIETGSSSFSYLAIYSKGKELQDLQKSLELIFKESKAMVYNIEKELDRMGLTRELEEKILNDDKGKEGAIESLEFVLAEKMKGLKAEQAEINGLFLKQPGEEAIKVLMGRSRNVLDRQALVKSLGTQLEEAKTCQDKAKQKGIWEKIEVCRNWVDRFEKDNAEYVKEYTQLTAPMSMKDIADQEQSQPMADWQESIQGEKKAEPPAMAPAEQETVQDSERDGRA